MSKNDAPAVQALPNLDALLPADSFTLDILNQDKQPIGWRITLAGPAHPASQRVADEVLKESLAERRDIAMAQANGKTYTPPEITPQQAREKTGRRLTARILDWNPVTVGGETFAYSPDNALKLATDARFRRVYEQILEYLGGEKAFTASSTNS